MKKVQSVILSALLAGTFTQGNAEETIDSQIAEIQKAPSAQRVQLMNRFKQTLANMNEEDQMKAMAQMRERLQTRSKSGNSASQNAQNAQKRTNQMNQVQHMNQIQHQNMMQIQNMNNGGAMQGSKR